MNPYHALAIEGPGTLQGEVTIEGAKNAALPCLVASLLTPDTITIRRVPDVIDIHNLCQILVDLGVRLFESGDRIEITASTLTKDRPDDELVRRLRASFLVLGPLALRKGRASVCYPGGCAIGRRPVDQHLKGLSALGFDIIIHDHAVEIDARNVKPGRFRFDLVTVTGTEHLMMTAAGIPGTTLLENCAREPEVTQLAHMLMAMGAEIEGVGTDCLVIHGKRELGGCEVTIIPDRIEAGTYILAAVASRGRIVLEPCETQHLQALLERLEPFELTFEAQGERLLVDARYRTDGRPDYLITEPYPGFPTDLQAQWMVLMTQVQGDSQILETVFPERFRHAFELNRMGAHIEVHPPKAVIHGPTPLRGTEVVASDLRASASLVIAALIAEGTTVIHDIYHLHRGYAKMEAKLRSLGVRINELTPAVVREPASSPYSK